jgi:hypothetical protein
VCNPKLRYSLVEETGGLVSTQVVSHELGHNLNAEHDPDGHFIMSTYSGVYSKDNFVFSPMSIESMKAFLLEEGRLSESAQCLRTADQRGLVVDRLPGLNWSVDDQCRQAFGEMAVADGSVDEKVCEALFCVAKPGDRRTVGTGDGE